MELMKDGKLTKEDYMRLDLEKQYNDAKQKVCNACPVPKDECPYLTRNLQDDCVELGNIMSGYEMWQEEMSNPWIYCDKQMPPEKKYESDNMQGHHEWTESELVLAWDPMYGPRVDSTRNGKWRSETKGGFQGQVVHGIVAWMPIPEYKEEY